MNRETALHFGAVPRIHQRRSKFNMNHSNKVTFNVGDCIPIFVDSDILPGDTVQMDMSEIVRMATPIYPVMDNMVMDLMWYFVPHRLVWEHWAEFWGENEDEWIQQTEYEIPQIEAPSGGWAEGTIADYMGIPTEKDNFTVNALPFRAYAKIWSDWFRDENLKKSCHIYKDETTRTGSNGTTYVTDVELGGMPAKAAKIHDYFTSALPAPQKGPDVRLPLGEDAPVETKQKWHIDSYVGGMVQTRAADTDLNNLTPFGTNEYDVIVKGLGANGGAQTRYNGTALTPASNAGNLKPLNLWTNLEEATAATVGQLRTAFALQKYFEAQARFGTRLIEQIRGIFGVESSDARLQRSEYLGGQRFPINMDQVLQTSSTDSTSPQGNVAGMSCTRQRGSMFTKSFEEHGTLICIAVARVIHSYQQGLHRMWSRKKPEDFYNPFFANLTEMPIYNKQIYLQGDNVVDSQGRIIDNQVFGYQEAWAEYRFKESRVCASMRSNANSGSLDAWHYADDYANLPTLGSTWIDEPKDNVDRTIAVSSQISNQFIGDFWFRCSYTRCMPVYSVPGLIDHV